MSRLIALIDNAVSSKSKCELLVYIHAYILGASHVPRTFIPDIIDHEDAEKLFDALFLSHPLQIAQKTHSIAKPYVNGYIDDINSKNFILQDIEAVIESSFGPGKLVYEESRFTPYSRSIYDDAGHLLVLGSSRISNQVLLRREMAKKQAPHQKRHKIPCNPVDHALRSSYEQKWALSWMHPSVYLMPGNPTKTIQTIWTHRFGSNQ